MLNSISKTALVLALAGPLASVAVNAQQISEEPTGDGQIILDALADLLANEQSSSNRNAAVPSIPSAISVEGGTAFVSGTLSGPRNAQPNGDLDASAAFGFGFGDASTGVGGQFVVNITGTDPLGDSGFLSFQLSRQINSFANPTWIGLTASNLAGWGDSSALDESLSLQITQFVPAGNVPIMWTLGVGTEVRTDRANDREGAFAGIGAGIADNWTAGVSTNFDVINVGTSYSVPGTDGMSISLSATDVAQRRGETVFNLSVGYSFRDLF